MTSTPAAPSGQPVVGSPPTLSEAPTVEEVARYGRDMAGVLAIASAHADENTLRREALHARDALNSLAARLSQLEEDRRTMARLLRTYGQHSLTCAVWWKTPGDCNCEMRPYLVRGDSTDG